MKVKFYSLDRGARIENNWIFISNECISFFNNPFSLSWNTFRVWFCLWRGGFTFEIVMDAGIRMSNCNVILVVWRMRDIFFIFIWLPIWYVIIIILLWKELSSVKFWACALSMIEYFSLIKERIKSTRMAIIWYSCLEILHSIT